MTRHARPSQPSRVTLLAGLTTGTVLAAAAAGASAAAAPAGPGAGPLHAMAGAAGSAAGPALDVPLNPLSRTPADPLSNSAGTQVADLPPVGTHAVTGPLADGASARKLPGEAVTGLLGGLPVAPTAPAGSV